METRTFDVYTTHLISNPTPGGDPRGSLVLTVWQIASKSQLAKALRDARLLPRGTRLREVRHTTDAHTGSHAILCFPTRVVGIHCVRLVERA
mgnify:CR=1 FL=1